MHSSQLKNTKPLLLTLAAPIAFGIILGIGVQYFLKAENERWFRPFLLGK